MYSLNLKMTHLNMPSEIADTKIGTKTIFADARSKLFIFLRAVGLQGRRCFFGRQGALKMPDAMIANPGLVTISYVYGLPSFGTMPELQIVNLGLMTLSYV